MFVEDANSNGCMCAWCQLGVSRWIQSVNIIASQHGIRPLTSVAVAAPSDSHSTALINAPAIPVSTNSVSIL